jgi:hypothetical protein
MRRAFRLVAGLVALSSAVLLAEGCLGEVDRAFIDDLEDASGVDGTTTPDGAASADGKAQVDATLDGTLADTGATDGEAPDASDAPDGDAGASKDADASTGPDANDASTAPDANDGGCGPTNTAANCGACGTVCNTTTTVTAPACNGTTCLYACMAGRQNCDTAAPDTNGCECAGTGCCAASCQVEHSNGVGQSFYDCNPLGTYTQSQAMSACAAYGGGTCAAYACSGNAGFLVCAAAGAPNCVCWKYNAGNSGVTGKISTTCGCPISNSAPSWN